MAGYRLRGELKQIRQIAAARQVLDSLAVLIAAAYRVGVELLTGDDGPDRRMQCFLRQVSRRSQ
ncbi:MAG: hypothetical protein ACRDTV_07180 [Mycobacterium sp.]